MIHHTRLLLAFGTCALLSILGCSGVTDSRDSSPVSDAQAPVAKSFDPRIARIPVPSKSMSLATDWTPAQPTRTGIAKSKPRATSAFVFGVPTPALPDVPSDDQLREVPYVPEPLRAVPGTSSEQETRELATAVRALGAAVGDGGAALESFVAIHGTSRWVPVVELNLGSLAYASGYFQAALDHWKTSWDAAKSGDDVVSQQLANQAIAEYAKMNARIGRMSELDAILTETESRVFTGDARVKMQGVREARRVMQKRPGVAFRCGPYALLNVASVLTPDTGKQTAAFLTDAQSPQEGFSLAAVQGMSSRLALKLQIAKRTPGAAVIAPAVVHWKVNHFAAVMEERDGRWLVKDPTFGNDTFMSVDALDREASGYFLVPAGALPPGWTPVTAAEAATLFGKGYTGDIEPDDTGDDDDKDDDKCPGGSGGPLAMATSSIHLLTASVHIEDTPVGYPAALGPDVRVRVAYNQREASQPTTLTFTSFGPQFVSNWISY